MSHTTAPSPDDSTMTTRPTGTPESLQTLLAEAGSSAATARNGTQRSSEPTPDVATKGSEEESMVMSLWLSYKPSWVRKFKQESPTNRSIMLLQLLEAFNDGVEGIDVSFSEPE